VKLACSATEMLQFTSGMFYHTKSLDDTPCAILHYHVLVGQIKSEHEL
jgi:hypothetical protein